MTTKPEAWLFIDFDNCLMGTEKHALPSLIARFNMLHGRQIETPLTLETFKANFHGQARETLCKNMSEFFKIEVQVGPLYEDREWSMMQHMQQLEDRVQIAPYAIDTLTALQQENYRLVFVSNNPIQRALAAMRYAACGRGDELARLFGTSFYEAGDKQKPLPIVYQRAMEQEGAEPDRSYAVEDSLTGIKSSVAAGIPTIGYTGFSEKPEKLKKEQLAHGCVSSIHDWGDLLIHLPVFPPRPLAASQQNQAPTLG